MMKSFSPYGDQTCITLIIQVKFPKYFTGKLHPTFYQYALPPNQKQLLKVTKALKRLRAPKCQITPNDTKSYEMYYLRNYRSAQSIKWISFQDYFAFTKLTRFQKKALKNYFQSQIQISALTIELDSANKDIYELLQYWFKKLNRLRFLQLYNFNDRDHSINVIQYLKQLIKQVSYQLKELKLNCRSSFPIQLIEEINSCQNLEKLSIQCDRYALAEEDLAKYQKLNLKQLTQFSCNTVFGDFLVQIGFLQNLHQCQELYLNLNHTNASQTQIDELCQLIPKKLKSLYLDSEGGTLQTNEQYDVLSEILVEDSLKITYWKPNNKIKYANIFKNKYNITDLELIIQFNHLKELGKGLLKFKNLQNFKIMFFTDTLDGDWPMEFYEFFTEIALKEVSITFQANCTNVESFHQILKACIDKSQNIQLIHLRQIFSYSELIPLVEFFLQQERKNYKVQLQNIKCLRDSINNYYKYQYRRLRWVLN